MTRPIQFQPQVQRSTHLKQSASRIRFGEKPSSEKSKASNPASGLKSKARRVVPWAAWLLTIAGLGGYTTLESKTHQHEMQNAQTAISTLREENNNQKTQLANLETNLSNKLNLQLQEFQAKATERHFVVEDRVSSAENRLNRLRSLPFEITRNANAIGQLSSQAQQISSQLTTSNTQLEAAQSTLGQGLKAEIQKLQETLGTSRIESIVQKIKPSTVTIVDYNEATQELKPIGAGVVIQDKNKQPYVLTAGHVVQGWQGLAQDNNPHVICVAPYIGTLNYSAFTTQVLKTHAGNEALSEGNILDLALLKVPGDPNGTEDEKQERTKFLSLTQPAEFSDLTENTDVGHPLITIGTPIGRKDTVTLGILSHKEQYPNGIAPFWASDMLINRGNSGGGAFSGVNGKLLGIATLKDDFGFSFIIPNERIKGALEYLWHIPMMTPDEAKQVDKEKFLAQENKLQAAFEQKMIAQIMQNKLDQAEQERLEKEKAEHEKAETEHLKQLELEQQQREQEYEQLKADVLQLKTKLKALTGNIPNESAL